jgi:hypothetical protein
MRNNDQYNGKFLRRFGQKVCFDALEEGAATFYRRSEFV